MKKFFQMLVILAFTIILSQNGFSELGSPVNNPVILYETIQLDLIKIEAGKDKSNQCYLLIKNLSKAADKLLEQPPYSVTQKTVPPPSGDFHDYVSLSTYYWPDPTQKDGLPYINKDGLVNPERDDQTRYDSVGMGKMCNAVDTLVLAYYLTGNEHYAAKAIQLIKVWFIEPDTRMNPNLNFGQGVPGKDNGRSSGIIDTMNFITIVDAANILKTSPTFSIADQIALENWFSEYLDWLIHSKLGISEAKAKNNHGVWYDAQTAAFAWFIGNKELTAKIVGDAKMKRINTQIQPDGSMPLEIARTRSLHYSIFNLEAFITLARLGDKVGSNLWDYQTEDGRGIHQAIDYVLPFILNKKPWTHQKIIVEKETGFIRYLNMIKNHYHLDEYQAAIQFLLGGNTSTKEKITSGMFP